MIDLSHGSFFMQDYRGKDLRGVPMHNSTFTMCKFDNADMTGVDASHSVFAGGSMRGTNCHNTDFKESQLNLFFEPSDAMGMTLTLRCSTFKGMTISKIWWYGWLYFAFQMKPGLDNDEATTLREKIKDFIGQERFERLDKIFSTRRL